MSKSKPLPRYEAAITFNRAGIETVSYRMEAETLDGLRRELDRVLFQFELPQCVIVFADEEGS